MARSRLFGAAALGAALLGGGVAGAVIATPALTSAQEEAPATEAPDETTTTKPGAEGRGTAPDEERGCRVGRHWFRPGLDVAAEALGITEQELRDALRDGSSIAELAEQRGVDLQTVIDALVAEATARIDEQVAEGDLDAERAAELKEQLEQRITDLVEREGLARPGGHGRGGWGRGRGPR